MFDDSGMEAGTAAQRIFGYLISSPEHIPAARAPSREAHYASSGFTANLLLSAGNQKNR